jgi:hypothetical protein
MVGMVAVGVIIVIVIAKSLSSSGSFTSTPAGANILGPVVNPSAAVVKTVGSGGLDDPWTPMKNAPAKMLMSDGKPEFFFWGAEFCPICAADRWSIINAVSRFGTLSGVWTMKSSDTDIFPNTNTFTFRHAHYSSRYISFVPIEAENRAQKVYSVPAWAQALVSKYDVTPNDPQSAGSFPFIDLANRATGGLPRNENEGVLHADEEDQYSPALSWHVIASRLTDPSSDTSQAIFGNANWLTAGICKVDGNKPANVCNAAPIPSLESKLKFSSAAS